MSTGRLFDWLSRRTAEQQPAAAAAEEQQTITYLDVDQIDASRFQARQHWDEVELVELAASIRELGMLQPVVVRPNGDRYELIMGERRLRAAKMAGLTRVPAIVRGMMNQEAALAGLVENLQRSNLGFWEEAAGYQAVIEQFNLTQEALAAAIGKSQSTIANKLRLQRLPQAVREAAQQAGLGERQVRALLRLPDEASQLAAVEVMAEQRMTAREADALVERMLQEAAAGEGETKPPTNESAGAGASAKDAPAVRKTRRRTTLPVIRDVRIMLNTVQQGVDALRKAGLDADMQTTEQDRYYEILIRIPKA